MIKQTLDEKQAEKSRLMVKFKAAQRAKWAELSAEEPRLPAFKKALRKMDDPKTILVRLSESWLRTAPLAHRYAALRLIDKHSAKMARQEGREPLNDPLPPGTNLYLTARELLAVR